MNHDETGPSPDLPPDPLSRRKVWIALTLIVAIVIGLLVCQSYLDRDGLVDWSLQREQQLQQLAEEHPVGCWLVAFGIYVLVAGLAIPAAVFVSLFYGWWLGFWQAVILVSFASTAGASIAFLISRSLLRDFVQGRYQQQLQRTNRAFEEEGALYLFSLRLMPYVPFWLVNLLMGLTPIRLKTFWWVSQLGMLPGTMIYIYAGSALPTLADLANEGAGSIMSLPLLVAFVLIGLFPLVVKRLWRRWGPARDKKEPTE